MKAIPKSGLTRFFARALPGANIALGGASAASRFAKGQYIRSALAAGSMIPGPIGMGFLGAEMAGDLVSNADSGINREINKNVNPRINIVNQGGDGEPSQQQERPRRQKGTQKQEQKRQQRTRSRAAQRGQPSKRQQRSRSRGAQRRSRFARKAQGGIVSINDMIGSL